MNGSVVISMCSKYFPETSRVTTDPKTSRNERHWDPSQQCSVTGNIQKTHLSLKIKQINK